MTQLFEVSARLQAFDIGVLYKILFAVECTSGPGSVTLEAEVFAPPQKGLFAGDSPHVAYVEQVSRWRIQGSCVPGDGAGLVSETEAELSGISCRH